MAVTEQCPHCGQYGYYPTTDTCHTCGFVGGEETAVQVAIEPVKHNGHRQGPLGQQTTIIYPPDQLSKN